MLGCYAPGRLWLASVRIRHRKTRRQVAPGAPVGNTGLSSPILTGGGIKETRRHVAPGAPVGNTGLASPILSGGGIKETRHRCAMCGFFME